MRVCIAPLYRGPDQKDGGIRRVVEAQVKYLPEFGWDVTPNPDDADLIATHGAQLFDRADKPFVNHSHGMMWEDYQFGEWGDKVNAQLVAAMVRAQAITAPSQWVAHAITRGMLVSPEVIHHGVDADEWQTTEEPGDYVLWNKARIDPVSDPRDMQALAALLPSVRFVTTYGQRTANVEVIGVGTYEQMKPVVQRAAVYLATTRETFGIGTLEALAAGVPVVGWDYGGQSEIIRQGETGILVPFGDFEALADAVQRAMDERKRLSKNAHDDALARWSWRDKIAQYAALYTRTLETWRQPRPKVSVIVPAYNMAHLVKDAIKSVVDQTMSDWECLVVDDCSHDHPSDVVQRFVDGTPLRGKVRFAKTPENLGLSGARNYGFSQAKGKYVLFLDADDLLAPNALDTLSNALDHQPGIAIAYGALDIMSEDGSGRKRNPWPSGEFNWNAQVAHLNQIHGACLMRREVLERSGGYRVRDWRAEDASFWARVTSFGFYAARVTDETIQIYRMHDGQKSRGEPGDGDWTAWLPWRLAGTPQEGVAAMRAHVQANPRIVPFAAQGNPPPPLKAWPVRHHQHPVVSVVIPVGPGHAEYLVDALDSVQAQTMPEWEVIVVDDSGGQVDIAGHPWARVLHIGQGHGAGEARNEGLRMARAPFVVFLDADDVLHPRFLEECLRAYDGSAYVYTDWASLEHERRIDGEVQTHTVPDYDRKRMLHQLIHAVTALVPTQWARDVGGFNERLKVFEDWHFYAKFAVMGYCGKRLAQPLLIYRNQAGLRTRTAIEKMVDGVPHYTKLGDETIAAIRDELSEYTDKEALMGCCGGGNVEVAASALNDLLAMATNGVAPDLSALPPGDVRMEFVGDSWGEQTYIGRVSGRQYRAGRDPAARYKDVDARDVEYFVQTGLFVVVTAPALTNTVEDVPIVPVEPRQQAAPTRVKGRRVAG